MASADVDARPTPPQLVPDSERLPGSSLTLEGREPGSPSPVFSGPGPREGVEASAQVDGCLLEHLGTYLTPPYQADVDQGRDASAVHRPGAPGRLRALPCVHVVDQVEA